MLIGVGAIATAVFALWFALAMGDWILEAAHEGRIAWFLMLAIVTFPWGPIAAATLEILRDRRAAPS